MVELQASVEAVAEAYRQAVFRRDVDGFVALYDPEVRIFDTWSERSYEGASAWRAMAEKWFSSLGEERVEVRFDDMRCEGGAGWATVSARVRYAARSAEGRELRSMHNRLSWMLKAEGTGWKIVHEHTSVPARFNEKAPPAA